MRDICGDCKGDGFVKRTLKERCDVCQDQKQIFFDFSPIHIKVNCLDCHSVKSKNTQKCNCSNGIKSVETEVEIEFEGNCEDGMLISIPNLGHLNEVEGLPGSLNIRVEVEPIPAEYQNEAYDLKTTRQITPYEVVLGGFVSIETTQGTQDFRIPENLNRFEEATVRYVGYGMRKPGNSRDEYGDLIVRYSTKIPEQLTLEKQKLYLKLYALENNVTDLEKYVDEYFEKNTFSKSGIKSSGDRKQDLAALWGK